LLLKNIPHSTVNVASILPRPEITDLLSLTYRRIPILAIGNDIYCDTSLIVSALERRFPPVHGFGTIFPPKKHGGSSETGLMKAFTKHYADTVLFSFVPVFLPWKSMPESFLNDRRTLWPAMDPQASVDARGKSLSILTAHLALINEQLQDGREWLFDTELPSLIDIGIEFNYNWARSFQSAASLFDASRFPYAMKWLDRMREFFQTARKNAPSPRALSGADAAQMIASSPHEPYDVVGFDTVEATRLKVTHNSIVSMVPDDTGPRFATKGKLVALNHEEFIIETKAAVSNVTFRFHFPRIGFTAKPFAPEHKL